MGYATYGNSSGGYSRRGGITLIIALIMAVGALFRYFGSSSTNVVTGQTQHVAGITAQQEIALGLQSVPAMEQQYGGEASQDAQGLQRVQSIGSRIVAHSDALKSPYQYRFHLLADTKTINAFALPGGQVFITEALYRRLKTEGQLAGVLGHEIGHVVGRHGAEHIAKQQLSQGLTGAAVLATYDPNNPSSQRNAAVIAMIGQLVDLKYSRNDELAADTFGVKFMSEAGYDPRAMIGVMQVLQESAGSGRSPEFLSTHPNPPNRIEHIKAAIQKDFPNGVPSGLVP